MKVKGQLERAQFEDRSSDYSPGINGLVWYNNTDSEVRYDDGSKVNTVVSKDKETSFSLLNNQSATDVTGLLFSSASHHRAKIEFAIRRRDDSAEQDCAGVIYAIYKEDAGTWDLSVEFSGDAEGGQPCGVTFTITAAGQIQYATADFNGGVGANYAGYLRFDVVKRYANFAT